MKKHLILGALLFTAAFPSLFGQTLQVGMRLEYLENSIFWFPPFPLPPPISVEIVGDTVIQGETWLQVQTDFFCNYDHPDLIREEGSRVYHFSDGEEHLLYDYSLNPGDTLWQTFMNWNIDQGQYEMMTYPIRIVDTSSVLLGGEWRKTQSIHFDHWTDGVFNDIGGPFIEGFGSASYFFPRDGLCESAICLRAVFWPNGDSTVVDSFTNCFIINSTAEKEIDETLSASPNPVQDMLFLHAGQALPPDVQVAVYDLHGRPVYRGSFADAEKGISVIGWAAGVYVAEIWDRGRRLAARVVIR